MELNYTFRFSDYLALCEGGRSERRRWISKTVFWLVFAFNMLAGLLIAISRGGAFDLRSAAPNLILATALLAFEFALLPWARRFQFRKLGLEGKHIKVNVADDAVRASQEDMESRVPWRKIVRFSKSTTHAFLWVNKVQAIVLPFDAFKSEAERNHLLAYVEAQIAAAALIPVVTIPESA